MTKCCMKCQINKEHSHNESRKLSSPATADRPLSIIGFDLYAWEETLPLPGAGRQLLLISVTREETTPFLSLAFGVIREPYQLSSRYGIRKRPLFTATWKYVILWGLADTKCNVLQLKNMICYHSHHAAKQGHLRFKIRSRCATGTDFIPQQGNGRCLNCSGALRQV